MLEECGRRQKKRRGTRERERERERESLACYHTLPTPVGAAPVHRPSIHATHMVETARDSSNLNRLCFIVLVAFRFRRCDRSHTSPPQQIKKVRLRDEEVMDSVGTGGASTQMNGSFAAAVRKGDSTAGGARFLLLATKAKLGGCPRVFAMSWRRGVVMQSAGGLRFSESFFFFYSCSFRKDVGPELERMPRPFVAGS